MALPGRQDSSQREALTVRRQVDLRREPAPAVTERRSYALVSPGSDAPLSSFGPPAAAWAAA
jgi:hypothetical protein